MKFPWKKEKTEQAQPEPIADTLSEDILGQIWGGGVVKADCHCVCAVDHDQLVSH